jgi:4-hydroxy-tetrahydrodipicolinate synthase
VVANVEPERTCALVQAALDDDYERARELHHELGPLTRELFVETNPIPVKEALHIRGHAPPHLRLPLTRLSDEYVEPLADVLADLDSTADDADDHLAEVGN